MQFASLPQSKSLVQATSQSTGCAHCGFKSMLFNQLTACELERLSQSKTKRVFKKGELIFSEGQKIREFTCLQNGLVKMSKRIENRKEQIISLALAESFIGFLSIFSEEKYNYSATALKETTVCFIDIEIIREIILKNGAFAMNALTKISKVSDEIIFNRANFCTRQLRGKMAYLLIVFAENIFYNTKFEVPLTRREMGELIDVSTENVIRTLSEFKKDQILKIEGSSIEILNFGLLERVSKFG